LHQFCKSADENLVKSWSETVVFGEQWSVFVQPKEFFLEEDYWQALFGVVVFGYFSTQYLSSASSKKMRLGSNISSKERT
jgi:hypothetical protein